MGKALFAAAVMALALFGMGLATYHLTTDECIAYERTTMQVWSGHDWVTEPTYECKVWGQK